ELYHEPVNLFVAGFIGSPAMNMVYGSLEGSNGNVYANFAGKRVHVAQKALDRHPGIENHMGKELVIGIRPGDFEEASVAGGDPEEVIEAAVDVAEVLGSETFIHYELPERPVITPDIEQLLADTGADPSTLGDTTKFSSRVSSDVRVGPGDTVKLSLDSGKFHFFDPSDGYRIGVQR
ncbi:MAG: ABC transporter ATP-binding protein, partial [Acidimicrobiia bacterium]|nr:ABC transporter ATP-binding protein [Acidimicrobiia bacterium]